MPRADLLVQLLKSASNADQVKFQKISEELIQEEKRKGHNLLADRLLRAMRPSRFANNGRLPLKNGEHKTPSELFHEIVPERELSSLLLPPLVEEQMQEVVEEQHRAELLHSYNVRARHRLLFTGPPGNGKTTLAEALAFELAVPLIVIRYESLIGSYLGETSSRIKNVLEYAKTQRCVLFFDEFETLGKERGDTHETGEIKRVVSSLLLQTDILPDYVVLVAASNHPELLDRAVWRRFQVKVELPSPSREQLCRLIERVASRCRINFGYATETLAKDLSGCSYSEAEQFCMDIVRRAILEKQTENTKNITAKKLKHWRAMLKPTANAEQVKDGK